MTRQSLDSAPDRPVRVQPNTPLPSPIIDHLVSLWGGDEASARFLREGTNSTFQFDAGRDAFILRVHHTGDRTRSDVAAELHWVDFLHRRGVRVAQPVVALNGDWVQTADWQGRAVHAAVFRKAPGQHLQLHANSWSNRRLIRGIGRTLGRIHALNREYQPQTGDRRFDWPSIELPRYAAGVTPPEDSGYLVNLEEYWQWIQSLPRHETSGFGLVHGDFQHANVLVRGTRTTVIDFDGSCYNWYLFDIAHFIGMAVLNAARDEAEQRASGQRVFVELVRGYLTENPLDVEWLDLLPGFLSGFQLLYYFNLLARFQFEPEKRKEAPGYELVRASVLKGQPLLHLDFRRLHDDVVSGGPVRSTLR